MRLPWVKDREIAQTRLSADCYALASFRNACAPIPEVIANRRISVTYSPQNGRAGKAGSSTGGLVGLLPTTIGNLDLSVVGFVPGSAPIYPTRVAQRRFVQAERAVLRDGPVKESEGEKEPVRESL